MKRLEITAKFSATATSKGYLDYLLRNQIFQRAIDAYAFAAAYALKNNVKIPQVLTVKSHSLAEVFRLDNDVRLALEAGVYAVCKRNGQPEPTSSAEVFDLVSKYAEAGLILLQKKWEEKTRAQIQNDVQKIIGT
ncbi:MAG: hypothetical protein ACFB4I_02635 [Cyanophyceae cyanobacterium]